MKKICDVFPINDDEYVQLDKQFSNLCRYATWQLLKKNTKNNHTDEFDDINQELLMSIVRAGSYYKRQVYIERCLVKAIECVGGPKAIKLLTSIANDMTKTRTYVYGNHMRQLASLALKRIKASTNSTGEFLTLVLQELVNLWHNRTRHGARRQKYGWYQEELLDRIVRTCVPSRERPDKKQPLKIDDKFITYAKAICWNSQKSMGRRITKEKAIRSGQVSLSAYNYLGGE